MVTLFYATGHSICAIVTVVAPPGGENEIDTIALYVRIPNIYGFMVLFIIIMAPDVPL